MKTWRIERLAKYNGQRAEGLVHTETWQRFMKAEQEAFDDEYLRPSTSSGTYTYNVTFDTTGRPWRESWWRRLARRIRETTA